VTANAERAASYLLEHARAIARGKLFQGSRSLPPNALLDNVARHRSRFPCLALLAERHVYRVPERAVNALFAWARGVDVEVSTLVPDAAHVLALQAQGRRSVTLLAADASPAPHASGFDFAIHDLCHLEKFAAGQHYAEQVGFFASLERAWADADWQTREAELDALWHEDRARVSADINGSAVYLLAVLKMKLKMAARRAHARRSGSEPPERGPLSAAELVCFRKLETALYDALDWNGSLRLAAHATSARRDSPLCALEVSRELARRGEAVLAAQPGYQILRASSGARR
jgi:hypothetical protein